MRPHEFQLPPKRKRKSKPPPVTLCGEIVLTDAELYAQEMRRKFGQAKNPKP